MNAINMNFRFSGVSLYAHAKSTYLPTRRLSGPQSFAVAYRSNYKTHCNSKERISMTSVCLKYLFWQGKIIQDKNTLCQEKNLPNFRVD